VVIEEGEDRNSLVVVGFQRRLHRGVMVAASWW